MPDTKEAVPASDESAEAALIGALLIDPDAYALVAPLLREADFSRPRNGWIFRAMAWLSEAGGKCDYVSLVAHLEKDDAGGAINWRALLLDLINESPSSLHVEQYAKQVADAAHLRRLLSVAEQILRLAAGATDPTVAVAQADALLQGIAADRATKDTLPLRTVLNGYFDDLDAQRESVGERSGGPGLHTGFSDLDNLLTGLRAGDLVLIAARPGAGKSALALNIGRNVALIERKPVLIFSLEMSSIQLAERLLASEASVDSHRLRQGYTDEFEWRRISEAYGVLSEAPIWLDESSSPSMSDIRMRAKRAVATDGIALVIVDYLQLIRTESRENRTRAVGEISHGLKALARELQVPVIALSQLSRALEQRQDHRPMLSDLRECVTGDTRVVDETTGRLVAISDLQPGASILSMLPGGRIGPNRVLDVWATGTKKVLEVVTRTGRRLTATGSHPLYTAAGWRSVENLRVGDTIATALRSPVQETADHPDLCRLLGYFVGDGCCQTHREVGFISNDPEALADVVGIVNVEWPEITVKRRGRQDIDQVSFSRLYANGYGKPYGNPLRQWLKGVGLAGHRDNDKRVPQFVFGCGSMGARQFLAGYLSTDGCVKHSKARNRWFIHFDTTSIGLALDVQMLLSRIGVVATVGTGSSRSPKATQDIYRTEVATASQATLAAAIGPFVPGVKGEKLGKLVETYHHDPNHGGVMGLPREMASVIAAETSRTVQHSTRQQWAAGTRRISRDTARRLSIQANRPEWSDWADSDLLWEQITSITPAGEAETFDLRMETGANFLANGIVAHNSGDLEADADVVLMLHREEQFNPNTDRRNLADLIVAKHRSGATGAVTLRWFASNVRFADVEIYRTE